MAYLFYTFLVLVSLLQNVFGQAPPFDPSPFSMIGTIDAMTLSKSAATNPLAGGSMTVDGIPITVPDNTIATLPGTAVAWSELFNNNAANLPGGQSWQATVFGNRVGDTYIAGLVYIAQNPAQILQGFITSINTATGHFRVAGSFTSSSTGIDCVLNDPLGVYGLPNTANPLWAVDPVNPSIHATTGFPMCIPRDANDPLCPAKNRPLDPATGRPTTVHTFKDPATIGPNDPDARIMAPLVVGDYITFSGVEIGGGVLAVNNLDANIGYYTAPGTKPVYVTCDSAAYGIRSPVNADPPETRAVAFTTDPTVPVVWLAMDQDACSGAVTERQLTVVNPSVVDPIGKITYRLGKVDASPATRNVIFRSSTGTMVTANNLTAGQFVQPIFNYIFPEITAIGSNAPPLAFEVMPFLAEGGGPFVPGNVLTPSLVNPPIIGQLSPWPGKSAPGTTSCGPVATSPTPSSTPTPLPPPKDTVVISSATSTKSKGGQSIVVVNAQTNSLTATLKLTVTGPSPLGPVAMNNQGGGKFVLTVNVKGAPTSVTVTSTGGGSATSAV